MRVVLCIFLGLATTAVAAGCTSSTAAGDPDVEAGDGTSAPEDTTEPPEDTTAPPEDTGPAEDTTPPPEDTGPPPPENEPPVATDDLATTTAGSAVSIKALYNDVDPENDTLKIIAVTQGEHGVVEILFNGTELEYTPLDSEYVGLDSLEYTVTDGGGGEDTATVTVNIKAKPLPPTLVITSPANDDVIQGDAVTITFEVTNCNFTTPGADSDGCHLHRYVDGVAWTEIGQYGYTPFELSPIEPGEHTVTVELIRNDGSDAPFSPLVADEVTFVLE